MRVLVAAAVTTLLVVHAVPGSAQEYRVRVDARAQAVSFRALTTDSIAAALVVPAPGGGLQTPDGHAVRCGAGEYCFFLKPGDALRGFPATTSTSAVLWGLGVEGLSVRATGRLVGTIGDKVWPGSQPFVQLVEGYVDYERSVFVARAGRQLLASRLEPMGFDGGWLRARWDSASAEFTAYAGFGLGQAAVLPVQSTALNPLDEWRPRDRQIVAGAEAAWAFSGGDVRAEYRREIDPQDDYFVSERAAISFGARTMAFRVAGGLDYNIAEGGFGSSDITLTYLQPRYSVSGGARRYRPYFSLWTLWGAFSPVAYNAVHVAAQARATEWLSLRARGERYRYDDAEVSTGLVPRLQDRGWRTNAGATAAVNLSWTLDVSYGLEHGPGAAGRFADGSVTYTPSDRYSFDLYGGAMARPLELRYFDASSRWIGGRAEWQIGSQRRLWGDVALVDDDRERPDASATSLTQFRFRAGFSLAFGSGADRPRLPPARRPGG